VLKQSNHRQ